ncbi:MAG: hypothetical protein ACOC5B_04105 [Myxococcota bacterium]
MTESEPPYGHHRFGTHNELEEACNHMDRVLAARPRDAGQDWARRLQDAARAMSEAVVNHSDIADAEDGPLDELLRLRPALRDRIQRQREEHAELSLRAHELKREIEEALAFDALDTEFLHLAATVLREAVRLHMMRGVEALFEAYEREEGGESG